MNIAVVWDADYPWDIRVEKICRSLIEASHKVNIICRNQQKKSLFEVSNGIYIHRLPFIANKKINYIFSFPFFFNPLWLFHIYHITKTEKIALILVRDLPLALTGILIGNILNIPVILDLAENYPAMLKDIKKFGQNKFINFFVRNPFIASIIEDIALRSADGFIVVCDEMKERLINKGVDYKKIVLVHNTPDLKYLYTTIKPINKSDEELLRKNFTIIYHGLIGPIRGLETIIKSLPKLRETIPELVFLIIGKGTKEKELKILSSELGVEDIVLFKGWVDMAQIISYIKISKIGIIPHIETEHTNSTIPNKLFDYMAFGVPVITSASKPMAKIVNTVHCGYVFNSQSIEDLTNKVIKIYKAYDMNDNMMGENGKKSVRKVFNWEISKANILKIVDESVRLTN